VVKYLYEVDIASADLMRDFGQRVGLLCQGGENIFLNGCLGAGKTCLVQGLARGLGILTASLTSPTFVLHAQYKGRLVLNHLDFYRLLDNPASSETLAIEEMLSDPTAVCAIEWPEALPALRQAPALEIDIAILSADRRRLTFQPRGPVHDELLCRLSKQDVAKKSKAL